MRSYLSSHAAEPLVSIIVIFLNAGDFLQEAIDSVMAQTYPNWELLLVDDGSSDRSTTIAKRSVERDPARVRYLEHPEHANLGMSASRNLGLRHAQGVFVACLDADDLWLPTKLERQVPILSTRPDVGALCGRSLFWFFEYAPERAPNFILDLAIEPNHSVGSLEYLTILIGDEHTNPPPSSLLLWRDACVEIGGWEDGFRNMYEDTVFLTKLLVRRPILITDDCLCVYRRHRGAFCHQAREAGIYDLSKPSPSREVALRWINDYLERERVNDARLRSVLRRELLPYHHPKLHEWQQNIQRSWNRILSLAKNAARGRRSRDGIAVSDPTPVSAMLRELARFYRLGGHPDKANLTDQHALHALKRHPARTYTALKGELIVAAQGEEDVSAGIMFRADDPVILGSISSKVAKPQDNSKLEIRLIGVDGLVSVLSAPEATRGYLLVRDIDAEGRLNAFAFAGETRYSDGEQIRLRGSTVKESLNARLLRQGAAYPAFDVLLADGVRGDLASAAVEARAAGLGIWQLDTANPEHSLAVTDPRELAQLMIWPKLQRRLILFSSQGENDFARFRDWLCEEDLDEPVVLTSGEAARLSTVLDIDARGIRLKAWPEEIIGLPESTLSA